jgi:hypothetical protein
MTNEKEKFTIKVTEEGVVLESRAGGILHFTAGEALMLLDILKSEEETLREMAQKASPLSISFDT